MYKLLHFIDKEQEADFEPQEDSLGVVGEETDGGAGGGGRVMSTIRTGGNKALTHTNSITTGLSAGLQGTRVPTHGVVTSHEEELGACLDNIAVWGIDVFRIGDLSSNRPLTAVTYRVFQERELLSVFKIPASNLVALLLTLEDHYLKVRNSFNNILYISPIHLYSYSIHSTFISHQEVPYHNSTHAADVTLSMNALLCTPALEVSPPCL